MTTSPTPPAARDVPVGLALGDVKDRGELTHRLTQAESLGFGSVLFPDRPTGPRPAFDPMMLAAVTAATTELRPIPVCLVAYRHPLHLARQLANIDVIAHRPVTVAAALGGDYADEGRAFGVAHRSALPGRLEETIDICRRAWSGDAVSYQGDHYRFATGEIRPRPRNGAIAVWLAHRARSARSLERTARIADGWLASWVSPDRLRRASTAIDTRAQELGRDPAALTTCAMVRLYVADTVDRAAEAMARIRSEVYGHPYDPDLVRHLQVGGPADHCLDRLHEFVEAGADELVLQLECRPEEREEQLTAVFEAILHPGSADRAARLR